MYVYNINMSHLTDVPMAAALGSPTFFQHAGMLFYLDFLAVCAQAYDFFQRFIAEWDTGRSILLLPNWAFSLALVTFQQAQQPTCESVTLQISKSTAEFLDGVRALRVPFTSRHAAVSAAKLDLGPEEATDKASEDLSRAVAVFPLAVKRLMARLNDQGVGAGLSLIGRRSIARCLLCTVCTVCTIRCSHV